MKKFLLVLVAVLLALSSCKTREKILYFQDIENGAVTPTQAIQPLTFQPGDKLSIVVTSSATPQLAVQFNLPIVSIQAGTGNTQGGSQQIALYTIDENGCIDIPTLGRTKVSGLTRSEAAAKIQSILRDGKLRDAVVTVNSYDQYITILGEVKNPGKQTITKDRLTIIEAIGAAGDLTIHGCRDNILVLRQEGTETKSYYVDLRSKDVMNSPVYNLRQNDVIYVQPNKVKMGQSTNNDNSLRTIGTWISIASFLMSLGVIVLK